MKYQQTTMTSVDNYFDLEIKADEWVEDYEHNKFIFKNNEII